MKSRLNLTIEEDLLISLKQFALKEETSVSELVENYFYSLVKPSKRKTILDIVEHLPRPKKISENENLKELFYKDQAKKNGF